MLDVKLISPEGEIFKEEVKEIVVRLEKGEATILPGHNDMISTIDVGKLKLGTKPFVVYYGYFKIEKGKDVLIVAPKVKDLSEIDINECLKNLNEVNHDLNNEILSDEEYNKKMRVQKELKAEIKVFHEFY